MDFELLSDDELMDIEQNICDYIDEYMENESLKFSSPKFYDDFIHEITNVFFDYLMDCGGGLCDEDDFDEMEEFVKLTADNYLEICGVPSRSTSFEHSENISKNFQIISEQIARLKQIPQAKQKSVEWYQFRYNLITASNLWKVLSSDAQRNSLIYEKCKPLDTGRAESGGFTNTQSPLHWGVKYEPLSTAIYEHMFQTKIDEFGCIQHNKYDFIGASPDGINVDITNELRYGRMLEIKNIVNRDITGIPKEEYWIQTQIQMETCDLDECDFVETRFKEYASESAFYEEDRDYKGVILYFIKKTHGLSTEDLKSNMASMNSPIYKYMPVGMSTDKESVQLWIETTKNEYKNELALFSVLYWYLDEFSCVLIKRNRKWFESAVPFMQETWNTILNERINGYEHRAAKKKQKVTEVVVKIDEHNNIEQKTQYIRNLPLSNSICLVRLDSNGNRPTSEMSFI